jgi:hypothetical protein
MYKRIVLCLLLFSGFGVNVQAQKDSTFRTTVVFIDGSGPSNSPKSKIQYSRYAVKVCPTDFFQGMFGAYYQRELGEIFSVEAGLGLTRKNTLRSLWSEAGEGAFYNHESTYWVGSDRYDEYDDPFSTDARNYKFGYFASISPQFFYEEDGFEEGYIGFKLEYRSYKSEAWDVEEGSELIYNKSQKLDEKDNELIAAVTWGKQVLNDKTVINWHVGLGYRNTMLRKRDVGYSYDALGFSNYDAVLSDYEVGTLYFEASFKIGLYYKSE